ncbi:receptor-binding cancer antigen [Triplophysa rosa]|uniref:Receptor-binding cancer antigen n=1 Tax=Triplophysa rosa TaxID=992332 RepID=A0A9W7WPX5_TRIRA|nr:receptor-binding cancer antigen [Triplophysa rosa]
MAITQFRLFKICTCLASILSFFKRLICRTGRTRKLSGDQITLPTTVDYSSVPKQPEIEEWSSWDEEAPTSIKIEGGNGTVPPPQIEAEDEEPDYFKDMAPTIRKTQKVGLLLLALAILFLPFILACSLLFPDSVEEKGTSDFFHARQFLWFLQQISCHSGYVLHTTICGAGRS